MWVEKMVEKMATKMVAPSVAAKVPLMVDLMGLMKVLRWVASMAMRMVDLTVEKMVKWEPK